jgi:hypothetical protein
MNAKRGLLRLWVVATVLYVGIVGLTVFGSVSREFAAVLPAGFQIDYLPVRCSDARGALGIDFSLQNGAPGPWDLYGKPKSSDTCWYQRGRFHKWFPEYADLRERDLTDGLFSKLGLRSPQGHPWKALFHAALVAAIPPILLLILGSAMFWAFAGFSRGASRTESKALPRQTSD